MITRNKVKEFILLNAGVLLMVIGIYFFKFPNNFSTGGVTGISVVLGSLFPSLSAGSFVLIINVLLLIIGLPILGKSFGIKTVYCSILMSLMIRFLEWLYPLRAPLTHEPLLELVLGISLPAAGSAILFNLDASTGGTDILAMIIKKYTSFNISKSLFCTDLIIVMSTILVFDIEVWIFSMCGFLAKVFLVNNILESFNMSKYCTIVTNPHQVETICRFIIDVLKKSATVSEAYSGAFTHQKKAVILVALNRHQAIELKKFIKGINNETFIIISNTHDIIGKGFREVV